MHGSQPQRWDGRDGSQILQREDLGAEAPCLDEEDQEVQGRGAGEEGACAC